MIKKTLLARIMLIILLGSCCLFITACNQDSNEVKWKDTASRPEIEPLEEGKYIIYPAKPTSAPKEANENEKPYVTGYKASDNSGYTISNNDNGDTVISYVDVQDWEYVYVSVENYHDKYGNFKITASGNGSERIAIQAVYYEMYENNYPAITVYRGDIADGSQYYIANMKEHKLLNESYITMSDSNLREMTVIGFMLFIDSNPSQLAPTDRSGSFTISGFEFLDDNDESLKDRYILPSVNVGFADTGYTAERLEDGIIHIERKAGTTFWTKVYLPIVNYSADYTAFNIRLNTTGVKSYRIELEMNVEGHDWQPSVDMLSMSDVKDGVHEHYIDFSVTQPISSLPPYDYVPGYFIKNYRIASIIIALDTFEEGFIPDFDATCDIELIEFERTVADGPSISKGWSPGSSYVTLGDDIIAGGIGSIKFSWHEDWYYMGMPVINYEKADKLVVKLAAPDGLDNIGIALTANGWEYVLHTSWTLLRGNKTEVEEFTGPLEGLVETIEYDEETSIYTFTFDFTNLVDVDPYNIPVNAMAVTMIRFYLNDPDDLFDCYFEGTRNIRFISVEFK